MPFAHAQQGFAGNAAAIEYASLAQRMNQVAMRRAGPSVLVRPDCLHAGSVCSAAMNTPPSKSPVRDRQRLPTANDHLAAENGKR